ncbi:MAG TPA: GGDEF domain-containing protein [Gemmatimonadales bacterium]|nr:GGDEF domain-containing protein [Gemmatimonadales bacterium]
MRLAFVDLGLAGWGASAAAALVGGLAGWLLGRRRGPAEGAGSEGKVAAHLLPDPALGWLRRAYGALGVWAVESRPGAAGQVVHQSLGDHRLTEAELDAVERRLSQARELGQGATERLEAGILLIEAVAGTAVGLLLPARDGVGDLPSARRDLQRLLEGLTQRPILHELAQTPAVTRESVGSIGLRLAYQLERVVGADAIVALAEPSGVRVVGVSGGADRRLLDTVAEPASAVARVARGEEPGIETPEDPVGGVVTDRRQRRTPTTVLPISDGGRVIGAVAISCAAGVLPPGVMAEIRETLRDAGMRIAGALELEQLGALAKTDPLTGLRNRRGLEEAMSRVGEHRGALVYLDLDRFKLLNDTLGHPAGDAALVHVARILVEQIRGGDVAARLGGEEFAVWCPGATLEWGRGIAERIRIKIGTTPWDWQGRSWPLSASFGVAACPETSRSPQNLAAQADAALYAAKKGGRNRVEVAPPLERGR